MAGFWRPPPGGARGQLPPSLRHCPPDKIPSSTNLSLRKPRLLDIYTPPPPPRRGCQLFLGGRLTGGGGGGGMQGSGDLSTGGL